MVTSTAVWTILADFHDEIVTDAEGAHVRKLYRRPTPGGPTEEIWDGGRAGACHRWTLVVEGETWLPAYGDSEGLIFWPLDGTRAREGLLGTGPARRLRSRTSRPHHGGGGDSLGRAAREAVSKAGWSEPVEVPTGNARLEHVDATNVQVSGRRFDWPPGLRCEAGAGVSGVAAGGAPARSRHSVIRGGVSAAPPHLMRYW